jgi:predicted HTH transcriptional regulator
VIGRVFHELKLIEQWGSGIHRMTAACRQAGLPDPEFEEIGSGFRVTFRLEKSPAGRDEVESAIIEFLRNYPGSSTSQIAASLNRSARSTQTRLRKLVESGQIIAVGSSPKDPRRRYHLRVGA